MIPARRAGLHRIARDARRSLGAVLGQPKRLTRLAYLVQAGSRGFQRRDVLMGLFLREPDAAHAPDARNQALYFPRCFLGREALHSWGTGHRPHLVLIRMAPDECPVPRRAVASNEFNRRISRTTLAGMPLSCSTPPTGTPST